MKRILLTFLAFACGRSALGQDGDGLFVNRVRPVLQAHCQGCHGDAKLRGGFDVRSPEAILRGSRTGSVVIPGQPDRSLLLRLVLAEGEPHMPPNKQLTRVEIADLARWIETLKPVEPTDAKGKAHWAFRKPGPIVPPSVREGDWVRTPIDAFVLARLEEAALPPAPPASRAELVRRLHYDLIGLPPSPDDVQAAERDPSSDWYAKIVDRLLASPHYGQRWGRHWLDLARYADSSGFHNDLDRPSAWRYRDYVIRSFNHDTPYGQFIREQLAGDEIDPCAPELLAATGFCIAGPSNDDNMGAKTERYRLEQLDDVISTMGNVFLGLTLGCARCHDHKYDPLPQEDYYRVLAIFNNTERREVPVAAGKIDLTLAKTADGRKPLKGAFISYLTDARPTPRKTQLLWRGNHELLGPEVQPGVPAVLAPVALAFPRKSAGPTTGLRTVLADWLASPENPLTYRVWVNRIWQHHFGRGLVATPSNFGLAGEKPTHPELLDWLAQELIRNEGRLKPLHRTIVLSATYQQSSQTSARQAQVDPNNLLWGRMNKRRLEAEALRDGILTVSGKLNLVMDGPGVKPRMHPGLLTSSQRNKWPDVTKEGPEHWRRSVYVYIKRQLLLMMFSLFDAPTSTQSCGRRAESTVPTQALLLMNDDFVADQAGFFADRVLAEAGPDPGDWVESAFRLALARGPSAARAAEAQRFLAERQAIYAMEGRPRPEAARRALTDLCHVLLNCNEFVYVD
jgi:hypothetical protein